MRRRMLSCYIKELTIPMIRYFTSENLVKNRYVNSNHINHNDDIKKFIGRPYKELESYILKTHPRVRIWICGQAFYDGDEIPDTIRIRLDDHKSRVMDVRYN